MVRMARISLAFSLSVLTVTGFWRGPSAHAREGSVEELVQSIRDSVVVIRSSDREGEQRGLGSGFVLSEDGLIATNFHVIGERRPFVVEMRDGTKHRPVELHAYDERLDLAVVRVEATGLRPLELGDSTRLVPGQTVAAVGNPLGFEFSASRGVVAAPRREVLGRDMVQVAMPIEPGQSGSPLVDLDGRVVGVIAIKSAAALGFAVPANDLSKLLLRPRPVSLREWLTIGSLDDALWTTLFGGRWKQRAGRLIASGAGTGFGGRMLCLSRELVDGEALSVEVEVKLDDESGAAGIAFHADGEDRHYGFYPTGGSLRLTRFDGPDVFSWSILGTVQSEHYRRGDWNRIRVDVDGAAIRCLVNGSEVFRFDDAALRTGRVGLVKFRQPGAQFRRFRHAGDLAARGLDASVLEGIRSIARDVRARGRANTDAIDRIAEYGPATLDVLEREARRLEKEAELVRGLARRAHTRRQANELRRILSAESESDIDLLRAALTLAVLDNEEIELAPYEAAVERMANEVKRRTSEANERETLDALIEYLFMERGFHGSRGEYYHRSNSYINEVLDDREGIPITLSVVFMEVARRVGLHVRGVGIPRHFICEFVPKVGDALLIDAFGGGKILSRDDAEALSGVPLGDEQFRPSTGAEIIVRMLRNLLGGAERERDGPAMIRYLDALLAIEPDSASDRWMRARLRYFSDDRFAAREDLDWLIERAPDGLDLGPVRELRGSLVRRVDL